MNYKLTKPCDAAGNEMEEIELMTAGMTLEEIEAEITRMEALPWWAILFPWLAP